MTSQDRIDKGMWWDRAWTLTKGCTPAGKGCINCWSAAQSHIRSKQAKPPPCYVGVTDERGKWNGVVEALPAALEVPLHVRKPTTFAVWNDLFHEAILFDFVDHAFAMMGACPQHTFQVLTKRPERMRRWFDGVALSSGHKRVSMVDYVGRFRPWPLPNVWIGASASTQPELDLVAAELVQVPVALRFLSLEPLLGPMNVRGLIGRPPDNESDRGECGPIRWIIVGAESGPNRRECKDERIESIVDQCKAAGTKVFVKQNHRDGRVVKSPAEFPQEMPETDNKRKATR